jgi:hypothetical protein
MSLYIACTKKERFTIVSQTPPKTSYDHSFSPCHISHFTFHISSRVPLFGSWAFTRSGRFCPSEEKRRNKKQETRKKKEERRNKKEERNKKKEERRKKKEETRNKKQEPRKQEERKGKEEKRRRKRVMKEERSRKKETHSFQSEVAMFSSPHTHVRNCPRVTKVQIWIRCRV